MTEHVKIFRNVDRRLSEAAIQAQLPEDAVIIDTVPQPQLPHAVAIIYSLPDRKHTKMRCPSSIAKPGQIKKPSMGLEVP